MFVNVLSSKVLYDFGWGTATPAFAKVSIIAQQGFQKTFVISALYAGMKNNAHGKSFQKKSADILQHKKYVIFMAGLERDNCMAF